VLVGVGVGVLVLVGVLVIVGVFVGVSAIVAVLVGVVVTVGVLVGVGGGIDATPGAGATLKIVTIAFKKVLIPLLITLIFDPSNSLPDFWGLFCKPIIYFLRITNYSSYNHFL
jgi:hypothetical protein